MLFARRVQRCAGAPRRLRRLRHRGASQRLGRAHACEGARSWMRCCPSSCMRVRRRFPSGSMDLSPQACAFQGARSRGDAAPSRVSPCADASRSVRPPRRREVSRRPPFEFVCSDAHGRPSGNDGNRACARLNHRHRGVPLCRRRRRRRCQRFVADCAIVRSLGLPTQARAMRAPTGWAHSPFARC